MMPISPQDPATQLNTFKTYVTLIADTTPGSKLCLRIFPFIPGFFIFIFFGFLLFFNFLSVLFQSLSAVLYTCCDSFDLTVVW